MPFWPIESTAILFSPAGPMMLAYLYPGTGSYVLQILLASLFGGMYFLKQSWSGLKGWFLLRFGRRPG
jgi:hypothetical protein